MAANTAQCFKLLGLTGQENIDEVRGAYRQIARRLHPDRNQGQGDGERFKQITAAYNHLVRTLRTAKTRQASAASDTVQPATWKKYDARSPKGPSSEQGGGGRWGRRREAAKGQSRSRRYADYTAHGRAQTATQSERGPAPSSRQPDGPTTHRAAGQSAGPNSTESTHSSRTTRQDDRQARVSKARKRVKSVPPVDANIEQAWQDWCEKTKGFEAAHRRVERSMPPQHDGCAAEDGEMPREEANEPTFGRLRRWLKRNLDRFAADDRAPLGGEDIKLRMLVKPSLIITGGQQRIAVRRLVKCPTCNGAGDSKCVCGGHGRIRVREVVEVDVKAGAVAGAHIRITEKGSESLDGGPDGDLIVFLEPLPIPDYRRDGANLHGGCTISTDMAARGGVVKVELPRGGVKINVPKNTRSGDRFRLKGQGLDQWLGDGRGDAYLTVKVA
ncbi:MAG: DnaJ C-terminal domain-containing protein [Myxococcota bacterium]|nr:DnaJ C-terminal domain-containing protein [Myxococcota bacterium]